MNFTHRARRVFPLFLLICGMAAARKPGDPLKPGFNVLSKDQDIQLGQEASAQVRKQYRAVDSPFLQDYVKRVGDRLASADVARSSGFPFTFTLIVDPSVNAFALPGGPMFINSGLLQNVDTEAQLAGVMAHEMGHVVLRHGTHQMTRSNMLSLGTGLVGAIAGSSLFGRLVGGGANALAGGVLLHYSRDAESEADAMGARLMSEAGWNARELAVFFEKLESQGGQRTLQILSDHPNPGNRRDAIEAEVRTFPKMAANFSTGQFDRAKLEAAKITKTALVAGPSGNVNGGLKTYNGQSFTLQYPSSWQAFGSDQANSVTLAPADGVVKNQVGLGAMVSYFIPDGRNETLAIATDDLIHHMQQQNPAMRIVANGRRTTVGGRDALMTGLESSSPFGGAESDQLVTVSTPDGVFYLVLIAPRAKATEMDKVFGGMLSTVRFR